ncbi:glycoside hydrolase family 27 protein [uncultured Eubacterium sp.]|uniref:glycoside hydrolase family 27 protein n=1 Tax=uncultured Eubacterium sp. TaxID=165185 RepID=UPI0028041C50|nr:glycoside hydrolase family 27 protein [uncultured Eubacterium sp.]
MSNFKQWAKTAPCGWNSWDCFGAGVNEEQLRANADYMAKNLKQYGWEYIVCDIQWYEPTADSNDYHNFAELVTDEYGRLMPAENRFPSAKDGKGFKPIADYVHSLGLKFGIHIMRGIPRQAVHQNLPIFKSKYTARDVAHHFSVCSWNTDMYGMKNCEGAQDYYNSIINMYAEWGVDFIKCDDIAVTEFRKWDNPYSADYEIEMLRKAIDNCGREIVLSLSPGPALRNKADHLCKNANMWRMTGDFWDLWEHLYIMFDKCEEWQGVRKTGNYPDCDMLPIGRISKLCSYHGKQNRMSNFTKPEHYTLMSLWGIFGSPLFIGGNMPENDSFTLSLLTNSDYMQMHKESVNPQCITREEKNNKGYIIWASHGKNCKYLAVFNTDTKAKKIKADLTQILMPNTEYTMYDIWQKQTIGTAKNSLKLEVEPHGARLIKLQ